MSNNFTPKFRLRKHIISLGWFNLMMISSVSGVIKNGDFESLSIHFLMGSIPVAIGHNLDLKNPKKEYKISLAEQEKRQLKLMKDLALSQKLL